MDAEWPRDTQAGQEYADNNAGDDGHVDGVDDADEDPVAVDTIPCCWNRLIVAIANGNDAKEDADVGDGDQDAEYPKERSLAQKYIAKCSSAFWWLISAILDERFRQALIRIDGLRISST